MFENFLKMKQIPNVFSQCIGSLVYLNIVPNERQTCKNSDDMTLTNLEKSPA